MFSPVHHLIVIFFRWTNRLTLIFLLNRIHVCIELLFVFFILFFLTFLLYFVVLLLFFFLLLNYSVASNVNRIIADLRYDCSGMRVDQWSIFDWVNFPFLKLLFFSLNLSFFLGLKLFDSVIKTWRFFQLGHWFVRRYFLQCFLQLHS